MSFDISPDWAPIAINQFDFKCSCCGELLDGDEQLAIVREHSYYTVRHIPKEITRKKSGRLVAPCF